jgi:hypothetical protein
LRELSLLRGVHLDIQDAQQEGDQELVEFFDGVLENNLRANQRAKEMLVPRLQSEQE